jgi:16S rRNA pseudouridine516 synthase
VVLTEGRYHQVRRMFAAVGNHVEALHRSRIGGLALDELAPGTWRILDDAERVQLFDGSCFS